MCLLQLQGRGSAATNDGGASEEAQPQRAPDVREDVHRPHADGGVDGEEGLGPAPDPALPEPHAAPGLLRPALLPAGGVVVTSSCSRLHFLRLALSQARNLRGFPRFLCTLSWSRQGLRLVDTKLFEGMKAFKGKDQQVRLFRPWLNMERMLRSARRLCLPSFDKAELLECIRRLIRVDKDWVPEGSGTSLYVRPVLIGNEPSLGVGGATQALLFVILCPVGSYFPGDAVTPVSLLADPTFIRAWMGGVGDYKLGGNYGPTVYVQREAQKRGCEQVLWLYGPDHQLTEVGTMNIFIYWTHEDGALELVTPPLDGIILPGVIRQSLLDLAQSWGEFRVAERAITMKELLRALEEGRVREVFGSGTACQVCPVHQILYEGQAVHIPTMEHGPELILRFQKELQAIQYGASTHEWMLPV
ncbi:branched-chain-amino-acid aminotransferase, mitochondrial isoform X3 [Oryctolagus cuniculus]